MFHSLSRTETKKGKYLKNQRHTVSISNRNKINRNTNNYLLVSLCYCCCCCCCHLTNLDIVSEYDQKIYSLLLEREKIIFHLDVSSCLFICLFVYLLSI